MIKRILFAFPLLLAFHGSFGQGQYGNIHVKVIDSETNKPVPFANVYISQTTIGGYTDDQGEIQVNKIPFGTYQLVISEVGHSPQQRKLVTKGNQTTYITVKLFPQMLKEVTIVAKHDRKWRREMKRFEKMFFGTNHFKQCKITNTAALQFTQEGSSFIASSKEPLKIENNYLGYKLNFSIKNCFFNAEKFVITGNVLFEEKKGDEKQSKKWNENREKVYRGSAQHFLKMVIDSSVTKEGYRVFTDITGNEKIIRGSTLAANLNRTIVIDTITDKVKPASAGLYTIDFPERLEVHYLRKRAWSFAYTDVGHAVSWIEVKKGVPITVSRNGIVQNPEDLTLVGAMSNLRVADWLPLDYNYTEEFVPDSIISTKRPLALLEKPYVQTDRDYYYGDETMWFKGYMSYSVPVLRDTLSQSIYIELSDASGNVVATRHYHMEEGKFKGDLVFDKNWKPGLYQLKAYTAWMLNFDKRMIFTKTVELLSEREAVRLATDYKAPADTLQNIWLRTDKNAYAAREKIKVTIDVTDSLEFATASDLSISVTDIAQAVPHKNEKSILTNYVYNEIPTRDDVGPVTENIEYGINFNGRFWLGKKAVQGSLSLFQENVKESFGIITELDGQFKRNLLFNDTVKFYIQAMSAENKRGRVVMDSSRVVCPKVGMDPLSLDVYTDVNNTVRKLNLTGAYVLPEFSIKAKRIVEKKPARIVGSGDYTVTGEWINEHHFNDIFWALTSRVPGLIYDPSGPSIGFMSTKFSRLNSSTSGTNASVLIVVDGMQIDDLNAILGMGTRAIDYIDVSKYTSASRWGSRGAGGVIEIHTQSGKKYDPNDTSFDKTKLQPVTWIGYSTASAFSSPEYLLPSANDYYDYRSTVYWSPSISTNGKDPTVVEFYAADAATKYRIVVEGVTVAGVPVRAEKVVEVVKGR